MKKIYVKIKGIHCSYCIDTIRKSLLEIPNVKSIEFDGFIACISYQGKIEAKRIVENILKCDYITKEEWISDYEEDLKRKVTIKKFIVLLGIIFLGFYLLTKILGFNPFNKISTIDTNITYGMLFITGLFTSIHCISMCGAIQLLFFFPNYNSDKKRILIFHLGRILSYTIIGGIAGLLGNILAINTKVLAILILLSSFCMMIMSLNMLGILSIKKIHFSKIASKSKNPFLIGLLNGLMPCGPLQAMQVYALSTGNLVSGSISMLIFGLGTLPLMLVSYTVFQFFHGKRKILVNKLASILIFILSIMMFNRGLSMLDINLFHVDSNYLTSTIVDNYQVVEFDLDYDHYQDIKVKKDIPVKMIIHVDKNKLTGCNNEILISKFNIKKKLEVGENIIYFTPDKKENITYTCWMNMIKNTIKVEN